MKRFRRKAEMIVTRLDEYEVSLLTALVRELIDLVSPADPPAPTDAADPFAAWARELASTSTPVQPPQDPAVRRLFPDAYSGDEAAAADFRRFTEHDLRAGRVREAHTVLARIATTEQGAQELRIPPEEVEVWLRTLTALRLTVGTRLGITDASTADELADLPDDDPRAFMASVYDWLGFAQETLLEAL